MYYLFIKFRFNPFEDFLLNCKVMSIKAKFPASDAVVILTSCTKKIMVKRIEK